MDTCIICNEKVNAFSKKTSQGKICKECLKYISANILLTEASTEFLKRVHDDNVKKSQIFDTTAIYKGLYLDNIHGMFCYSKKEKRGNPAEYKDIYRIDELTEVGLYCTNVKNIGTNSNKIICDIKFKIKTKDISGDFTLVRHKNCDYKISDKKIEWCEPGEFTMFRNMFRQMIDDEIFGVLKKLQKIQECKALISSEEKNIDWAKGILFLDRETEYTNELIKAHRNNLVKIFHPDKNSEFADTEIAAQINNAYKILTEKNC